MQAGVSVWCILFFKTLFLQSMMYDVRCTMYKIDTDDVSNDQEDREGCNVLVVFCNISCIWSASGGVLSSAARCDERRRRLNQQQQQHHVYHIISYTIYYIIMVYHSGIVSLLLCAVRLTFARDTCVLNKIYYNNNVKTRTLKRKSVFNICDLCQTDHHGT